MRGKEVEPNMRIESDRNLLEISVREIGPDDLPSAGDLALEVSARIGEFSGRSKCWVAAPDVRAFSEALSDLHESLIDGAASLDSMSPGEFSMLLEPGNRRGSIRIAVELSTVHGSRMSGSFEVEPGVVTPLVKWAHKYSRNA
jgi:hypothetical protein